MGSRATAGLRSPANTSVSSMGPVSKRLVQLTGALRQHGVVVGTSDAIDAGRVLTALGAEDRERLREGFAAALLRRSGQREVFDQLFDVYFPAALGERSSTGGDDGEAPPGGWAGATPALRRERAEELRDRLSPALANNDEKELNSLAALIVGDLGEVENAPGNYSAARANETLNPQLAISRAANLMANGPDAGGEGGGTGTGSQGSGRSSGSGTGGGLPGLSFTVQAELARDEARDRVAAFRRRIEAEARRRNSQSRGADQVARYAVTTSRDRTEFALTATADAAELRTVIAPLARKLATMMAARRKRNNRGQIDIRRTLRAAMSTAGVPIKPVYANRAPARTDLVVLADMSSSVSGFSRFTILLMQAISAQFRRLRVFGFINVPHEVTEAVLAAGASGDASAAFADLDAMTSGHTGSDYGTVFTEFVEKHLDSITPRTVVLILGDARTNHTNPQVEALRTIAGKAKHVAWLNPESARMWGSGDSVANTYGHVVDMHECRNVEQLRLFVTRSMPV